MSSLRTNLRGYSKVISTIKVVTSLPGTLEDGVTYLVGAQDSITISGLDGNTQQLYKMTADVINPTTGDTITLRYNGISSNVYDYKYSYAGSTSATAAAAQPYMAICPSVGTNSSNHIELNIDASTGINRNFSGPFTAFNSNQQTVNNSGICSGNWRDNSTNVTSIVLGYASITGGFGVGTVIRLSTIQS